jgi:flagellin-like hook-associated protein FlgL
MIGGLTSSLALAQRTASKERANMDAMSRQIATGQKVSSVKDDGAAWARVANAKSDQVTRSAIADRLENGQMRSGVIAAGMEQSRAMMAQLRDVALTAAGQTSPSAMSAIEAEFSTLYWGMIHGDHTNRYGINWGHTPATAGYPNASTMQTGAQVMSTPNLDGTETVWTGGLATIEAHLPVGYTSGVSGGNWYIEAAPNARIYYQGTTPFANWNPVLSNETMAREAAAYMTTVMDAVAPVDARHGAMRRRLDSAQEFNSRMMDAASLNIASLSDADLSAASTQLRQSEARQQLALDTIKTALTAYGNYAGGLLGNVQRTQRGVLA